MSDVVPVRLVVGGRTIAAGATRSGQWWTISAAGFPGKSVTRRDIAAARAELERILLPEVQRLAAKG